MYSAGQIQTTGRGLGPTRPGTKEDDMKRAAPSLISAVMVIFIFATLLATASAQTGGWLTHSHDDHHTALSTVQSQDLDTIHWSVPVDLNPPQGTIYIHYGSPLVTPANTVIVPVKTGTNSFRVEAHAGGTGALIWMHKTGYQVPTAGFTPGMGPTIFGDLLYIPDSGGRVMVRKNPDSATGGFSELYFFGEANFKADPTAYEQNVLIDTPLTTDASGNLYFGFIVTGSTPLNLASGIARITPKGLGSWVSAATVSGDSNITQVATSCAPALSNDGTTVYVVVNGESYGYLLALNSSTLGLEASVLLKDPASGLDAFIYSGSSATPTVGPDGDVYFGVLENPFPSHNDRGWMLHFSSDLSQTKIPGSFGWDDTPSIVPASLVASYKGKSSYLLMTKYNNYANIGTGNGKNRIAILDPNAEQDDPIIHTTKVMRQVITILGVTPDPGTGIKGAVREWCINTAAVDPFTNSVLANSEDGKLYRWDLTNNSFSQRITLSSGIGEAYTPTLIGADGTAYAINDAVLYAVGASSASK